ncbi:hypothetical protein [Planktotalea sp.]|uniref:hypothetical protein n=1 Tax=Planktotalea sp. TaxID=2029877 RepID=UPI00329856DA
MKRTVCEVRQRSVPCGHFEQLVWNILLSKIGNANALAKNRHIFVLYNDIQSVGKIFMNTTPYFDEIGQTVPMEGSFTLRIFAVLRLCFVTLAVYICVLQFFQIGFWSGTIDRGLIFLGILSGMGLYSDGIEFVWRKLGPFAQLVVLLLLPTLAASSVLLSGRMLISGVTFLTLILLLAAMACGLCMTISDPLRTARYRQIQRFLRTLPKSDRRAPKLRLERDFQTLMAEGFR